MKNVIVVDRMHWSIETFLQKNYRIVVLIVETEEIASKFRQKYDTDKVVCIFSREGITKIEAVEYLNFDIIDNFRDTQRKVDFSYHRETLDNMLLSNKYFNVLSWWNHIFDIYPISFVFVNGIEHILLCEICLDVAKNRKIPAFITPYRLLYSPSLFYFNERRYIPFVSGHLSDDELEQNFFFEFDLSWIPPHYLTGSRLQKFITTMLLKLGGGLLVMFVGYLIKLISLKKTNAFWKNFYYFVRLKKLKAYYKKISHKPDYNQQFVFYAVHFEPEGNTNVCVPLQNQLTCIQMLSCALPKGVKLYVKEHPLQFMLNKPRMFYYLPNFTYFKDISFYTDLQKLPNVEFIDIDTSSKELIDNALAVATINGTVHFESTFNNKPCIVFGGYNIMLKGAKNLIYVEDFEGLKRDLQRLVTEPQSFDNSAQLQNLREFVKTHATFHTSPTKAKDIIDSIENFLQQEEKPESQNQPNNVKESTDSEQSKSNDYVRARLQGGGEAGFIPAQMIPLKGIE